MTTKGGLEYALNFLRRKDAGQLTLFGALPCTWGTSWQYMQEHRYGKDPKYRRHMDELFEQFTKLIRNYVRLAREVTAKKGRLIFEWPAHNRLWRQALVVNMEREFKMQRVRFDGCALGLASDDGALVHKPWAFSTNCPLIREAFAACRCDGPYDHAGVGFSGPRINTT